MRLSDTFQKQLINFITAQVGVDFQFAEGEAESLGVPLGSGPPAWPSP